MIGEPRSHFHFARAFLHHHHRFVGLRLNGLDERGDVFRRAARVFREFADFVGDHGETAAGIARARRFNRRVQGEQVRLFRDVVNHVDDFRNFQRTIAERLDFLGRGLHRGSNALHAFERIAHGAVALFGGVQSAARGFGAGFRVV